MAYEYETLKSSIWTSQVAPPIRPARPNSKSSPIATSAKALVLIISTGLNEGRAIETTRSPPASQSM
ncbi:MAG: hypothetical protein VX726_07880 [Planctomycetota bacterium]|nr:hypothetical protein [Planctomycetota bacterium]